jgi:hypothetical protein
MGGRGEGGKRGEGKREKERVEKRLRGGGGKSAAEREERRHGASFFSFSLGESGGAVLPGSPLRGARIGLAGARIGLAGARGRPPRREDPMGHTIRDIGQVMATLEREFPLRRWQARMSDSRPRPLPAAAGGASLDLALGSPGPFLFAVRKFGRLVGPRVYRTMKWTLCWWARMFERLTVRAYMAGQVP